MTKQLEQRVVSHYETSDLLRRIERALASAGADPSAPSASDLKPVDEFHTGGLQATENLLSRVRFDARTRVLDLGCGLGGTARWIVDRYGAQVTGVDLTPDYIAVARELTQRVGLYARFEVGSALSLPLDDGSFDVVTMFHVGMNIQDKDALFAEVARVLTPGGRFALFDVLRLGAGELKFPFPWAETADFSFVEPFSRYRDAARAAGFALEREEPRVEFTLEFFERAFAAAAEGPPPVGIHLLMGENAALKLRNYVDCVRAGLLGPVEMVFRKPDDR